MTTYYNHTHMTAVPTRLLLDTNLSAEAKLTGALLYTCLLYTSPSPRD